MSSTRARSVALAQVTHQREQSVGLGEWLAAEDGDPVARMPWIEQRVGEPAHPTRWPPLASQLSGVMQPGSTVRVVGGQGHSEGLGCPEGDVEPL